MLSNTKLNLSRAYSICHAVEALKAGDWRSLPVRLMQALFIAMGEVYGPVSAISIYCSHHVAPFTNMD